MNALHVENLTKKYPRFTLEGVSLTLERGRIMGLIGKNGAGKTTALKAILHLISPDGGRIEILGLPCPERELECRQKLGVVLGGIDFYRDKKLSAITNVTRRFYREWDEAAYRRYLEEFALDPVSRDELLTIFRALAADGRRSILYSTHITSDLEKCADDITYIKDGRVLASGEKGAFLDSFQHLRTRSDAAPLTLEDIMVRTERREFHV